jgi:hypothetical protein
MPARSPEEIRQSVEATREELKYSLNDLQAKTNELTDWRRQLVENPDKALPGAAAAGFLLGGGIAGLLGLLRRG